MSSYLKGLSSGYNPDSISKNDSSSSSTNQSLKKTVRSVSESTGDKVKEQLLKITPSTANSLTSVTQESLETKLGDNLLTHVLANQGTKVLGNEIPITSVDTVTRKLRQSTDSSIDKLTSESPEKPKNNVIQTIADQFKKTHIKSEDVLPVFKARMIVAVVVTFSIIFFSKLASMVLLMGNMDSLADRVTLPPIATEPLTLVLVNVIAPGVSVVVQKMMSREEKPKEEKQDNVLLKPTIVVGASISEEVLKTSANTLFPMGTSVTNPLIHLSMQSVRDKLLELTQSKGIGSKESIDFQRKHFLGSGLVITPTKWAIAAVRKQNSDQPYHVSISLQGMDEKGKDLLYRIHLVLDRELQSAKIDITDYSKKLIEDLISVVDNLTDCLYKAKEITLEKANEILKLAEDDKTKKITYSLLTNKIMRYSANVCSSDQIQNCGSYVEWLLSRANISLVDSGILGLVVIDPRVLVPDNSK